MLQTFRKIGLCEAVSFLVLLGVAMPLKYLMGLPLAVKAVGWAHGLLFVAYVFLAFQVASEEKWPASRLLEALIASVIPFGPLFFDRRLAASGKGAE